MTSQRHSSQQDDGRGATTTGDTTLGTVPRRTPSRAVANRVDDADLLRAARECVLANGVRRSTLTEIARRAGVSRMTLYRRYPDVRSVVTALMTREFERILQRAQARAGTGSARRRLVNATVHCVSLLQEDPLLGRVLRSDAELLLPYLVERLGSTQLTAERFLREYLAEGHADGSVRRSGIEAQARALLLLAQSFVLSARAASAGADRRALLEELARLLDAALIPAEANT